MDEKTNEILAMTARARRLKAIELRVEGHTMAQIAERLGISEVTARKYVNDGLRLRDPVAVSMARELETDRLDRVVQKAFEIMDDAPPKLALEAMDRIIRAVGTRAGLLGLNAPVQVEVKEITQMGAEMQALVEAANAANERIKAQILNGDATVISEVPVTDEMPDHPLGV